MTPVLSFVTPFRWTTPHEPMKDPTILDDLTFSQQQWEKADSWMWLYLPGSYKGFYSHRLVGIVIVHYRYVPLRQAVPSPKEGSTMVNKGFKKYWTSWWFHFFYFNRKLGKISNLTHIFQIGWFNHQLISWEKTTKTVQKWWMKRLDDLPLLLTTTTCHVTMGEISTSFMGFPWILLQGWPTYQHLPGKYSGSQAKGLHKSGTQRGKRDVWERCVGVEKKRWLKRNQRPRKTKMPDWRNHHF